MIPTSYNVNTIAMPSIGHWQRLLDESERRHCRRADRPKLGEIVPIAPHRRVETGNHLPLPAHSSCGRFAPPCGMQAATLSSGALSDSKHGTADAFAAGRARRTVNLQPWWGSPIEGITLHQVGHGIPHRPCHFLDELSG